MFLLVMYVLDQRCLDINLMVHCTHCLFQMVRGNPFPSISSQTSDLPKVMMIFLQWWIALRKWHIFFHVERLLLVRKRLILLWEKFSSIMAFQMKSLVIVGHNLLQSFGHTYLRSLEFLVNYLQVIVLKLMVKLNSQSNIRAVSSLLYQLSIRWLDGFLIYDRVCLQ